MPNWRRLTPGYSVHMRDLELLSVSIVSNFSLLGLDESLKRLCESFENCSGGLAEVLQAADDFGTIEAIPDSVQRYYGSLEPKNSSE